LGLTDSSETSWEGKQVSRFKILEQIGKGGMGEVYLAEDTSLGRQVAVKFLPQSLQDDEVARRRFVREAKSAAALDHPFICSIHEVDETSEGQDFIVMEYVEGQTLSSRLSEGPLPLEEILQIACDVAEALEEAHEKGIVHRDIKPSNIMLTRKGHAKVMDFGLAKGIQKEGDAEQELTADLTSEGAAVGTVAYMSPEQILGKTVDHRSDLFSFGVVLYELTSGRHPFKSDSAAGTLNAILNKSPEPLNQLNQDIPSSLHSVIQRLLEKDPQDRFQSTNEVVDTVKGIVSSPGLVALPRSRSKTRRHVAPIVILGLVLLLLAVIGVPELWQSGPEISSLAVLPLENHSDDPDQEYLADEMTHALIQELGQISHLRVVSRTSVMRYKESTASLSEIAKELDVDAVLEGETTLSEGRIRISARLIDADSDEIIWGETFESDYAEILRLQSEVAQSIARQTRIELTSDEEARFASRRVVDPEAHENYLRGRYLWSKRSKEGLEKAVVYYKTALEIDSECALAYAGLADAYAQLGDIGLEEYPRSVMLEKVRDAAVRALEIDDTLAEAHTALANARFSYDWEFEAARREFEIALEINPDYATARHWYGLFLASQGQLDEALAETQIALKLDPVSAANNAGLARCFYYRREYEQAVQHYLRALELEADFGRAHLGLALVLFQLGRYGEAFQEFSKGLPDLKGISNLRTAFEASVSGNNDEAQEKLRGAIQELEQQGIPAGYLAVVSIAAGKNDEAFFWLGKAFEERSELMLYLGVDPIFDNLRQDPQFESLRIRVR
jgi:serine/threonine-protein kinase